MNDNRISAVLSPEDSVIVMQAIATLREKLPFLKDISVDERRSLPKMGDKSRAFVSKALEVATQNPGMLPRSFDLDEMRKDVELAESLYPIVLAITQLQELLEDTYTLVGSEAYAAALLVYSFAKTAGKGSGLDAAIDEMGKRFARKARGKESNEQSVNP